MKFLVVCTSTHCVVYTYTNALLYSLLNTREPKIINLIEPKFLGKYLRFTKFHAAVLNEFYSQTVYYTHIWP